MKIVELETLKSNQRGKVKITPERPDDFWIISNLIQPNDIVSAETTRKIQQSSKVSSQVRVRFNADVKIVSVDYFKDSTILRLRGKVHACNNSNVTLGSFHTLELEKNKAFVLEKKIWDPLSIEKLKDSRKKKVGYDLVMVLVNQEVAQVYLVGESVPNLCATICGKVRGKLMDSPIYFEKIMQSLSKYVDFSILQSMIIAGPGSMKSDLRTYLKDKEKLRSKIVIIDVDVVCKKGLMKVLRDPNAMKLINGNTTSSNGLKAVRDLNMKFVFHPEKACYGSKSVELASELSAIDTLLIMEDLYKNDDSEVRKKYIKLVDSVKGDGGKVAILSPKDVSLEELTQLTETGIAAILRFSIPEIEDLDI